ncbi:hypothetical protein FGF04_32755 [Streptomyces apricus]|uniref:Uncharacterized protein n=1 Tax=Streptomyces apricus TaxID=1828112 RepID=A0A5B0A7G4_9ACTN|nr:hypothetical protein FGF04_32755 [Streptomyces apricus]
MPAIAGGRSRIKEHFWWRSRTGCCSTDAMAHDGDRRLALASHLPVWKAGRPRVLKNDRREPPRFRPAVHVLGGSGPTAAARHR